MKTEILKSFSSIGCDCQLQRITFDHSKQVEYQVSVRFCVVPEGCISNYQVVTFGCHDHSAKECFHEYVFNYI